MSRQVVLSGGSVAERYVDGDVEVEVYDSTYDRYIYLYLTPADVRKLVELQGGEE